MNLTRSYSIIFLIFIFISTVTASTTFSTEEDASIVNTLYQVKYIIRNRFTSGDIVNMVEQAIEKGAIGFKVVRPMYSFLKDMGWLIEDSKGREVFRVLFTFNNNGIVSSGRFLGPLISKDAKKGTDQQFHQIYTEILSRNFKLITTDSYNLDDGCKGIIKLSKSGVAYTGRTVITVECPN